ncbi:Uncharacterized coiled-coil protein SlyX (sensitive to lysis X) [Meinhardsimonia xiamenensis]|jgi:SlyX protein|uniref:Uncharacterized coiled-coil protein SlyX (Sensitive to lysis X) n=1 Tax=Meinhardsimonia xiamenensis TaxID=990712 RepID=A0A1G8Y412_9RHOB|nr:SlyX family protein [Meinhardsimonia xiamenensis]PRX37155.1 putative coiled-coil protein SlyX [Meinhardsimonia xiamenensis]SDJ97457.1 Uncharacterized coiled-coil protein SlyX (sensitive to lysis X) [Meinhardsimonia xiamenensis]
MSEDRITALEERVAELIRVSDELSEVVAAQRAKIERLTRLVEMLTRREAEREAEATGAHLFADERPPHW